jgi:hypothetical protein
LFKATAFLREAVADVVATMAEAAEIKVMSCIVIEMDRYNIGGNVEDPKISIEGMTAEHLKE